MPTFNLDTIVEEQRRSDQGAEFQAPTAEALAAHVAIFSENSPFRRTMAMLAQNVGKAVVRDAVGALEVARTLEEARTRQASLIIRTLQGSNQRALAELVAKTMQQTMNRIAELVPQDRMELLGAIEAYQEGDEEPLWAWVENKMQYAPDRIMRVRFGGDVAEIPREAGVRAVFWFVDDQLEGHKRRLERANERQVVEEQTSEIRRGIRRYRSIELALKALAAEGQKPDEVLEDMIPGIAYTEQAELPQGSEDLPGRVANQIRREGLELPHDPGRVFVPDTEVLSAYKDDREALAFAISELWAAADLSDQEAESFVAALLLGSNKKAAAALGRSAQQVGIEKHRAGKKFRRII